MKELSNFTGAQGPINCASWHPVHEDVFVSGGHDGALLFWLANRTGIQVPAKLHLSTSNSLSAFSTAILQRLCNIQASACLGNNPVILKVYRQRTRSLVHVSSEAHVISHALESVFKHVESRRMRQLLMPSYLLCVCCKETC